MANRFLIVCGGTGYKLLGQRTMLGLNAELQVDVSRENVSRDWKVKDQRSLYLDLDQRVATTAVAFNKILEEHGNSSQDDLDVNRKLAALKLLVDQFPSSRNLDGD